MSRLIWIYTVCCSFVEFRLIFLFVTMDVSKFKDGILHCRKLGMKGLNENVLYYLNCPIDGVSRCALLYGPGVGKWGVQ